MKALVLSGGGSHGSFQTGVLKKLLNENPDLDYDIYAGVSVGALNASLLSTGSLKQTLPDLENIWLNEVKGNSSIWNHNLVKILIVFIVLSLAFCSTAFMLYIFSMPMWSVLLSGILSLLSASLPVVFIASGIILAKKSIYTTKPLRKLVEKNLNINKLKTSGKKLRIGAVSYNTGKYRSVNEQNENIIDWIMASSAFPVFFPMIEVDGEKWLDGGVVDTVPLQDAIEAGATEIDVIITAPLTHSKINDDKIFKQISRSVDIMSKEIMKNDINCFKTIKINIISPKDNFDTDPLNFHPDNISKMYAAEYEYIKVDI